MSLKNSKIKIILKMSISNICPFHIGIENNNIMMDKESCELCIPGTTVAGAFRAYLSESMDEKVICELFGQNDEQSKVFIYDSFAKMKDMEVRSGIQIDDKLGSVKNKKLFDRNFIGEADSFKIEVEINDNDENRIQRFKNMIYSCICAIQSGDIGFGAYKNVGAGNFKVNTVEEAVIHFENKTELFSYLNRKTTFRDIMAEISEGNFKEGNDITFELNGQLMTSLLIKGTESMDKDLPDGEPVKNSKGTYIIPGSSLKGVIRAQGERILNYYNIKELSPWIFGSQCNSNERIASRLKTFDTDISNCREAIYNRIKLDKFTSGVYMGAKMDDKAILGNLKIRAKLKRFEDNSEIEEIGIAVIALVFRDIAVGDLSIGSGYNIGRGRIKGELLTIYRGTSKIYEYNLKENIVEMDKLEPCFEILKRGVC